MHHEDEILPLSANLEIGGCEIKSVRCEVILPRRLTDYPKVRLYPSKTQIDIIHANVSWVYSIQGSLFGHGRKVIGKVEAGEIHSDAIQLSTREPTIGEPVDLVVARGNAMSTIGAIEGRCHTTANELLQPALVGHPTKKKNIARQFKFRPDKNTSLSFSVNPLNYGNDEIPVFSELICDFKVPETPLKAFDKSKILQTVDDVLLLASLAARWKTTCLKWTYPSKNFEVTEFLRDRTFPREGFRQGYRRESLIDLQNFGSYMTIAYRAFQKLEDKEPFRRLINFTLTNTNSTVEADYISLYSALEMLVARFRRTHDLDIIFPHEKFKDLKDLISDFMKKNDLAPFLEKPIRDSIKRNKTIKRKRGLMKQKLGELNRVSFGEAFSNYCAFYGITLNDLWPVTGSKGSSLSEIRNRLVHGAHFGREHSTGLIYAREHLRWIVERMVLATLKFPIKDTNVSPDYLMFLNPYSAWRNQVKHFENK